MENLYITFNENGEQLSYHDQECKDISAEIEAEMGIKAPVSYLAPKEFNPLEDMCKYINNEVIIIKGKRTEQDNESREKRTIEKKIKRFQAKKQVEIDEIKGIRESKFANFTHEGTSHYANERAVNSLRHKIDICEVVGDYTYNGYNFNSKEGLENLYKKMCIEGEQAFLEYYKIRAEIDKITTEEELNLYKGNK